MDTPFELACMVGEVEIVKDLVEKADASDVPNMASSALLKVAGSAVDPKRFVNVIDALLDKGADLNVTNDFGRSALHEAAMRGRPDMVQALLERKADHNVRAQYLWTSLHSVADNPEGEQCGKTAKISLKAGLSRLDKDVDGWTPMHLAARQANVGVMRLLFKADVGVLDSRTNDGQTVLHFAYDEPDSAQVAARKWHEGPHRGCG